MLWRSRKHQKMQSQRVGAYLYETPLNVVPTSIAMMSLRDLPAYGFLAFMVEDMGEEVGETSAPCAATSRGLSGCFWATRMSEV